MCRILDLPMLAGIIGLSLALWQKHPNFTQRDTFFTHSLLSLPGTRSNRQTLMTKNMETNKPVKAVALISGGLDSTLAALIIRRQGIDVEGPILRPLTANGLEPTIPEQRGWVDRSKLYGIGGRSRKEQKRLAQEFGISDYPQAGGGCRLTYEGFSRKMRDLIDHKDPDENDTFLLLAGRHFRTSRTGKAIVGKDQYDNERLKKLARDGDMSFEVDDGRGPTVLLRDADSEPHITLAASLCVSHTKLGGRPSKLVRYWLYGSEKTDSIQAAPLESEQIEKMRI